MKKITTVTSKQSLKDVSVGENVIFYDFINAYGCQIGDNTKIGAFAEIQEGVVIGKNCKISSHSFICSGVIIEDNVFIGHNVTFINDRYPRAVNPEGSIKKKGDWQLTKTLVKKGVSIGSSSTILCGLTIGENAIIGAGSVVTKDVPTGSTVTGNPAKVIKQ